jgi:hypothetical protein
MIEVLPTPGGVAPNCLHSSFRSGIYRHVHPRRRDLEFIDPLEVRFCKTAILRLVTESTFGAAESPDADSLQTFELCHAFALIKP